MVQLSTTNSAFLKGSLQAQNRYPRTYARLKESCDSGTRLSNPVMQAQADYGRRIMTRWRMLYFRRRLYRNWQGKAGGCRK